ncbi:uncharacterized protein ARMOST_02452 [Armillaria ostoyae]|uniref:Uncharacterized protein n=1 Tax=Armillaria ostoyae TaxID=47428 RepID=A0A284QRQ2_ARMOS|nr:uncharacterized protein ARMOST_02452 [Armillaria ostoyae]
MRRTGVCKIARTEKVHYRIQVALPRLEKWLCYIGGDFDVDNELDYIAVKPDISMIRIYRQRLRRIQAGDSAFLGSNGAPKTLAWREMP